MYLTPQFVPTSCMAGEYYERLGVSKDATVDEIESAYRERLKHVHPDVSDKGDARERTRDLIEAKKVLTDENKRARYDRLGHERFVATEFTGSSSAADTTRRTREDTATDWPTDGATTSAHQGEKSTTASSGAKRRKRDSRRRKKSRRRTAERQSNGWAGSTGQSAHQGKEGGSKNSDTATDTSDPWRSETTAAGANAREAGTSKHGGGTASGTTTSGATTNSTTTSGATTNRTTTSGATKSGAATSGAANQQYRHRAHATSNATRDSTRGTTEPHGGHSVGWYEGGDPSGSTPGSWAFGGQTAAQNSWGLGAISGGPPHEQAPFVIPPNGILSPGQNILFFVLAFISYPVFTYGTVMPVFAPGARILYAILLVLLIGFLIVMPQLGVAVSGSWTVLFPPVLFFLDAALLSVSVFMAFAVSAFTLGLCLASRTLIRSPPA